MATAGAVCSCPYTSYFSSHKSRITNSTLTLVVNTVNSRQRNLCCLAVQESSTSTAEAKEKKDVKNVSEEVEKPKAAAKAPVKSLPELMEEDVIPSLKLTLQEQKDIQELEIVFTDNKLEGSFLKQSIPYSFWAFFPDGNINGPKGFSLSSYGSGVSTVEPFLVDEKKPTAKHVVFWVEKRLAAQGIIPVWNE